MLLIQPLNASANSLAGGGQVGQLSVGEQGQNAQHRPDTERDQRL